MKRENGVHIIKDAEGWITVEHWNLGVLLKTETFVNRHTALQYAAHLAGWAGRK